MNTGRGTTKMLANYNNVLSSNNIWDFGEVDMLMWYVHYEYNTRIMYKYAHLNVNQ